MGTVGQMKDKKEREPAWKIPIVTWKDDFWKNTNIVGLTNAASAENAPRKVFWIVVFLLFFGWTVKGLYDLFLGLYDTDTAIKINGTSYLLFPAVTFCNQNRVNCARLTDQLEDQSDSHSANILQWIRTTVCSAAPSPPNGRKRRQAPSLHPHDILGGKNVTSESS